MKRVFISYVRSEQAFAEMLFRTLVSWEMQPWMDRNAIQPGERWWNAIDEGLKASEVVVGLFSRAALGSMNVLCEWNWALSAGRKLVLVRLERVASEEISHRFIGLQWIDYRADEPTGFAALKRTLEGISAVSAGDPPPLAASGGEFAIRTRRKGPVNDRNRAQLLERVRTYWIDGVLRQAVNETNRFHIGYALAPDAVVKHADYTDCVLPAGAHVSSFFQHLGSEVLILGTPGSGKTILLLQLAEALLAAAQDDETLPIPMVLNLASWSARRVPIEEWIVTEAKLSYQVSRRTLTRWLGREKILPLLDGLDEVVAEHRDACVEAINRFRHLYRGMGLAVCSRVADYELLKTRLDLRAAVLIQPLSDREVDAVISRPPLAAVRTTLAKEPWLAEMTHTPFLLNVMSYAYADKAESELRLPASEWNETGRTAHLLDTYISRRLADGNKPGEFLTQRLRSSLAWLGARMQEREQTIFHIENLQKDWLSKLRARCSYCLGSRLAFGLLVAAVFWIGGRTVLHWMARLLVPSDGKSSSTVSALTFGLVCSSEIVSLFGFVGACSATMEFFNSTKDWRWRKRLRSAVAISLGTGALTTCVGLAIFGVLVCFLLPDPAVISGLKKGTIGQIAIVAAFIYFIPFGVTPLAGACCLAAVSVASRISPRRDLPIYILSSLLYWLAGGVIMAVVVRIPDMGGPNAPKLEWDWLYNVALVSLILGILKSLEVALASIFSDKIESADRIQWRWNWRATLVCTLSIFTACQGIAYLGHAMGKTAQSFGRNDLYLLVAALVIGLIGGVVLGFRREEQLSYHTSPNQGVFRSARAALTLTLVLGGITFAAIFGGLLLLPFPFKDFTIYARLTFAGMTAAFLGSIGAMIGGADVPVKHLVLRALLTWSEKVPWRFQRFLDQAVDRVILRRVGGGYLFIHRSLREHCAKIHAEQNTVTTDSREK